MVQKREGWHSKLGFILAAAGSAVGLANIWRFPYVVGSNGGAAFLLLYLLCLGLIGLPVFLSEILIGRESQRSPSAAFPALARGPRWLWSSIGKMTILTGFIVSSFYSAIAGQILGYLVEAACGNLTGLDTASRATQYYQTLTGGALWALCFHGLFLAICTAILFYGVQHGIERGSKILMPLLFLLLVALAIRGALLPGASRGLRFLITPDWAQVTPVVFLLALGQSFFTLSLGQGTMVTYGSYLGRKDNVLGSALPVVAMDTVVSLLAAVAVMTVVFSAGMEPTQGPGLLFETMPIVFSQTPGGYFLAIGLFLLVSIAAITSEVSAMEPTIAALCDRGWGRHRATLLCAIGVFVLGVPSALSFGVLSSYSWGGATFFDWVAFATTSIMIPLGGLAAVLCVGWSWGTARALEAIERGGEPLSTRWPWLARCLSFSLKYTAPLLIVLVFLHALQWI